MTLSLKLRYKGFKGGDQVWFFTDVSQAPTMVPGQTSAINKKINGLFWDAFLFMGLGGQHKNLHTF